MAQRIGVDVGGTNVKIALVSDEGKIIYSNSIPTRAEMGYEYTVNSMKEAIRELLSETKLEAKDIEGMGLKFVKGAEQTIKRDRPLLSLSIYHNADEFAGIYQTLKSWNLNYHYELKQFSPMKAWSELSLLAYPKEWIKQ